MTTKELENYEPKEHLEGFPKEIIARMLECQAEQGNKRDISVFEEDRFSLLVEGGLDWDKTKEGYGFWYKVILKKDFDPFFEKYPKKDNQDDSQEFNLENYVPKGELEGFPKEVIKRMLDCQEEQGTKRDVNVFEKYKDSSLVEGGFDWEETKEKDIFWYDVICNKDFDIFFKKYSKKDNQYNSQKFKIGDEVIDIISGVRGKVTRIDTSPKNGYPIFVEFNDNEEASFALDGRYYSSDKHPSLLHYRDDYNYDVIDFNNLPKRQEANRWRAKEGKKYYYVTSNFNAGNYNEHNSPMNNADYNSGNYFQTKKQAQEVADKLKEYFNQLINSKK